MTVCGLQVVVRLALDTSHTIANVIIVLTLIVAGIVEGVPRYRIVGVGRGGKVLTVIRTTLNGP